MHEKKFYILNTVERPDEVHIVEVVEGGVQYIHPNLRYWNKMELRESSTPIEDFGFTITFEDGEYLFRRDKEGKATYTDGKPRNWQGHLSVFKLKGWDEECRT